jgi:hypothetical protein
MPCKEKPQWRRKLEYTAVLGDTSEAYGNVLDGGKFSRGRWKDGVTRATAY